MDAPHCFARLADRLGLDDGGRYENYWVTLLATVCTGESFDH